MSFITNWIDKITGYFEVRMQLAKLSVIECSSHVLGYFVFIFLVLSLLLPIFIFGGIGLSEVFTTLFDSRIAGYFTTLGIYVLILVILILCRKSIATKFANIFVAKLTEGEEEDKEEKK